jgi:hypothetical protein
VADLGSTKEWVVWAASVLGGSFAVGRAYQMLNDRVKKMESIIFTGAGTPAVMSINSCRDHIEQCGEHFKERRKEDRENYRSELQNIHTAIAKQNEQAIALRELLAAVQASLAAMQANIKAIRYNGSGGEK